MSDKGRLSDKGTLSYSERKIMKYICIYREIKRERKKDILIYGFIHICIERGREKE